MSRIHVQRSKRRSRLLAAAAVLLIAAWWSARRDAAPSAAAEPAPPAFAPRVQALARAAPAPGVAAPAGRSRKRPDKDAAGASYFVESLDRHSRYALRDGAVSAFLDERGIALSLVDGERAWGVRWSMAGARRVIPAPSGPALPGVVNDLRGDPASQRTGLRTYDRVVYRELFGGVDLEVEPRRRGLEYTLRVAPGARVPELRFALDGARSLSVEDGGETLAIETGVGRITEGALLAYQDGADGVRREVPVRYAYARRQGGALAWEYGLEVGPHDPSLPLVIDPTLAWSTYLGGSSGDFLYGMAIDSAGNRYLTGYTISPEFPTVGGFQTAPIRGSNDGFVTKVSGTTENILWSTLFGGTKADQGNDIAVDASSNVYVVGSTLSGDIAMVNGFQPTFVGTANKSDAFILKIAANGSSILAGSYLGGDDNDSAEALFLDSSGNVYVTGSTSSGTFPVTAGAFQTVCGSCGGSAPPDTFVAKIGTAGSMLTKSWATFLGGNSDDTGYDIAADASGVWVTGFTASSNFPTTAGAKDQTLGGSQDAFLTKLNPGGTALLFSTYLGGSGVEVARGLAIDASGNAYVGGTTQSADFPTFNAFQSAIRGPQDIFVTELNATGSTILWSSYIGGGGNDFLYDMAMDAAGQIFIGGMTDSTDWPLTPGAPDTTFAGTFEAVIARVDANRAGLGFSTYLGGSAQEQVYSLGWDAAGNLYASGTTQSTDFPTTASGFQLTLGGVTDSWIARITGAGVVPSAGGPTQLVFTTGAQTINAGACSAAVTVQAQDASSMPANVASATTVTLSASPATGFGFYSDPGCTSSIGSVTIAAGTSTAPNFYFKDNTSGSYSVTATAAGLTGSQVEVINPLAATKLVLLTGPFMVAAGTCSPVNTVQRQDTFGNPVITGTTTTVTLSATAPAGFAFYSDSACSSAIPFINIGPSASSALYYFSGVTAGTATVTDSATGLISTNTQNETITAAAPSRIMFITASQMVAAGSCNQATVERQDQYGNAITTGSATVSLTVVPVTGFGFYSNAACSTASSSFTITNVSQGSFFWKGTAAGSFTVNAASTGLATGAQPETINAGAASKLAFVSPPQTVVHGRCSPAITVQTQDGFGNASAVAASTPLTISSPQGTMTFYSNPTCVSPLSSPAVAAGTNAFLFYFKDTGVGSKTLNVAATGFTGAAQAETLTNIAPVANAGPDQSQGEGKPVTLTGLASSDGDTDPITYQWSQTGGPAVTLSSTTAAQPSFTTPTVFASTPLTFQLVVNDGFASSAADAVVVTVNNDVNEAPVANAGADQSTTTGMTFTLDGRGSSDPNGTPVTYLWSQIAGPAVTLANPTTATQSLVAPFVAVSTPVTFQLVVNDGAAPSNPDTVVVTVGPPALPQITSVPRKLTAAGVAYQYDADSKVDATGQAPLTFSLLQGPPGFSVSSAGVVAYTPAAAVSGTFPIRIQVSNAAGNTEQDYSLKVVTAPVITSTPRLTGNAFAPYRYDADGLPAAVGSPSIGWSLVQAPPGAVVVHDTGEILWTPLAAGPAQFLLRAANAFGSDDQPFVVQVGAATPPAIDATANPRAQLGQPYAYDADGRVGVTPAGAPVSVMSGPPGFRVDSLTGEVSWMPLATGVFDVQLVAGVPPLSSAPYAFQVTVVDVPAAPPIAVANASPASGGGAPLDVVLDGTASSAAPNRALVMFEWDPGDGTPPIPSAQATHTYGAPGGYTPSLSVTDELGQRGLATTSVQVGAGGALPPAAKLFVDSMRAQADGSVEVTLRCQCSDPQGQPLSYFWELGDGAASSAAAPVHAYQSAGTFRVRLTASNATLSTRASIDVVVRRGSELPPEVRAYASPVRGRAPLLVQLTSSARDPDGYVLQRSWAFPDDGSSSDLPSVAHLFASPGVYPVTLQATDDDGLTSSDRVEVTVLAADGTQPPRFASLGAELGRVGEAYSYDGDGKPTVTGDAPLSFTLEGPPAGATIDAQTGAVTWTPRDSGVARLVITATNAAGSASQVVLVQVQPPAAAPVGPCGCGQAGGVPAVGLLALLAAARSRRRRLP